MTELLGLDEAELRQQAEAWGLSAYRGTQLYHALYKEHRWDFNAMTNLPADLREQLSQRATITLPRIVSRYPSRDGAIRYVLQLPAAAESPWL